MEVAALIATAAAQRLTWRSREEQTGMLRPITFRRAQPALPGALSLLVVGTVMTIRLMVTPRRNASACRPHPSGRRRARRRFRAFGSAGKPGPSDSKPPRREPPVLGVSGQLERLRTHASSGIAKMTATVDLHDRIGTELDCVAYELGIIRREMAGMLQPARLTLVENAGAAGRPGSSDPESIAA